MRKLVNSESSDVLRPVGFRAHIEPELASPVSPVIKSKRGGARNFANRTSDLISVTQARTFLSGIEDAIDCGRPPNVHKTLNLAAMGIEDEDAVQAIGQFMKSYRDWLARKGERLVWNWVRENPAGGGTHVHILMHVPPEFAPLLRRRQYHWLNQIARKYQTYKPRKTKGRIHTSRIGGTLKTFQRNPSKHRTNLNIVVGYVLKGASNDKLRLLGITRRHVDCGTVIGKRVGRWQRRRSKAAQSS